MVVLQIGRLGLQVRKLTWVVLDGSLEGIAKLLTAVGRVHSHQTSLIGKLGCILQLLSRLHLSGLILGVLLQRAKASNPVALIGLVLLAG